MSIYQNLKSGKMVKMDRNFRVRENTLRGSSQETFASYCVFNFSCFLRREKNDIERKKLLDRAGGEKYTRRILRRYIGRAPRFPHAAGNDICFHAVLI